MKTLHILDVTGSAFRSIHAAPYLCTSTGIETSGVFIFTKMILAFLEKHKPTHVVAVWDSHQGRNYRKDISPEYKANRPPLPDSIKLQLKLCRAVIKALPLPTLAVPNVEADDTMASLAVRTVKEGNRAIMVTSDKDLHQFVGPVEVYDPVKATYITADMVRAKRGVEPNQISDLLALAGDSSDNIKGVEGIGDKTAATLLKKYKTLSWIVWHADQITGKRGDALRLAIADGSLEISRSLAAVKTDVEIPLSMDEMALPPPDEGLRRFLFGTLEFHSLMPSDMPTLEQLGAPVFDERGKRVA